MKAVVLEEQGSLDHLKVVPDFPDPVVTEDHVVIRVKQHPLITTTCSLSVHARHQGAVAPSSLVSTWRRDSGNRAGRQWLEDRDRVLVNPLNRQRGLMGEMMHGGLAEKCLVAQHQLIRMPDRVSYEDAASLLFAYARRTACCSRTKQ